MTGYLRRTLLVVVALALVAAACGDSADTSTTAAPAPRAESTAPPTTMTPPPTTSAPTTTSAPATTVAPPTTPPETSTTVAPTTVPPSGWTDISAPGGPSARSNAVIAYDAAAGAYWVHGGRSSRDPLGDLWRFDTGAGTWEPIEPEGDGPTARFSHTAVWDTARSRLVIFSGQRGGSEFFSDVWAYDPAANAWIELAPSRAGPLDRYGSCAGYDEAGDRFLISHGFTNDGRFDDTWAFDLATDQWTEISPDGNRPLERCLHTCTYDPAAEALVLFGGQSDVQAAHDDAWILDGGAWSEVPQTGPAARKFPSSSAVGNAVVVFGGEGAEVYGDTWTLDLASGATWVETPYDGGPAARHSHAAYQIAESGAVVIFGGETEDGEVADLWVLQP